MADDAVADDAEFDFSSVAAKKAVRDYKKAMAKDEKAQAQRVKEIETEDAKAIKKTRNAFLESLQKALKKSMQAGNLEEANKIDAAIKSIQKGHGPTEGASASGLKGKEKPPSKQLQKPLIIGVWKTTAPPGGKDVFIVRPNKTAYHSGLATQGRWEAINKSDRNFIIRWSNGVTDNIKLNPDDRTFNGSSPHSSYRWQMSRDQYPPR